MKKTAVRLLQMIVAVLALVVVCYGLARIYLAHEITRADQMLNDLQTIKVGDNEDLALSVSRKYDGYRREHEVLRQLYEKPDYQYVVQVDPWRFWQYKIDTYPGKLGTMIGRAATAVAPSLRKTLGLRRWSVLGIVSVRQTRVVAVTATTIVEGRHEWLGGSWYLYETIPDYEIEQLVVRPRIDWPEMNRYLVGWTELKFGTTDGGGESAEIWITPSATQNERQSASQIMLQCLTSRSGCQTICDFFPAVEEYARSVSTNAQGNNVCSAPRPNRYW